MSGLWQHEDTVISVDWWRREMFPNKDRVSGLSYQAAQPAIGPLAYSGDISALLGNK